MNNQLLTFLETLENSTSISEAAQKLYLSQPYLSRVIKKYEQQYNVILVKRDTKPIKLTPAAHLLIKYLRKNLQLQQQLKAKMKQYEKDYFPTLQMGITPPLGEKFNLAVLPQLFAKFPNLQTKTFELSTADAEKAFQDGQLDLFVGNPILLPNVKNENLYTSTQVLVLGKHSRLYVPGKHEIKLKAQDLNKINHEKFIVTDGERGYQVIINNYFSNIGLEFYPSIHVRDSTTALKLAALGLGNMTTSIEAVNEQKPLNINYVRLPRNEINVNFSISTIKSPPKLTSEIKYTTEILKNNFVDKII